MVRRKGWLSWCVLVLASLVSCQGNSTTTPVSVASPGPMAVTEAQTPIPHTVTPEVTATSLLTPSMTPDVPVAMTWHTLAEGQFFSGLFLDSSRQALYFVGVISDVAGLWRLDLSTSSQPVRVSDAFGADSLALSPDGSKAVLSGESTYVVDLGSGETLLDIVSTNQFCLAAFVTNTRLVRACTTVGEEPSMTVVYTYEVVDKTTTELVRYPGFPHKLEAKPGANVLVLGVRADSPQTDQVVILNATDGTVRCTISSPDFSVDDENATQVAVDGGDHSVAFVNISDCGAPNPIHLQLGAGVFRFFAESTFLAAGAGPQVVLIPLNGTENQKPIASKLPRPYVVDEIVSDFTPDAIYVAAVDEDTYQYAILEGVH